MIKIEQQVARKKKRSTFMLKGFMVIAAILFLLMGIVFRTGYMFFCFIFAGMYFIYEANAEKEYEYSYIDGILTISVIKARRKKVVEHVLDISKLEVVAPHDHESVAKYKKGMGNDLPKYDYTSYEENIKFYTMIIYEDNKKIKLLLDLNDEMLGEIKRKYPGKVYV